VAVRQGEVFFTCHPLSKNLAKDSCRINNRVLPNSCTRDSAAGAVNCFNRTSDRRWKTSKLLVRLKHRCGSLPRFFFSLADWLNLHELPAEPPFDAKIAMRHAMVER
jgi:hypothetical protein